MYKLFIVLVMTFGFFAESYAAGVPCTVTNNTKKTLECINDNVNYLLGLPASESEPVYIDDLVKVTAHASRHATSNPNLFKASVTLHIKNLSGQILRIEQNGSNSVTLSDDAGISCPTNLYGFPRSNFSNGEPTNPNNYVTIKPGKIKVVSVLTDTNSCFSKYEGSFFDISLDLLRYDDTAGTGLPFSFSLTGINAPLK